jgi:RNA polymerase sigma-70 factor (ECF subfamily)
MFYDFPLENKEIKNIVNLAIDSLPEQYKEIIIMKENMDMSYNEIAKVLDLSLSAVRIRIFRAKEKLKNILTPYLKDLQG